MSHQWSSSRNITVTALYWSSWQDGTRGFVLSQATVCWYKHLPWMPFSVGQCYCKHCSTQGVKISPLWAVRNLSSVHISSDTDSRGPCPILCWDGTCSLHLYHSDVLDDSLRTVWTTNAGGNVRHSPNKQHRTRLKQPMPAVQKSPGSQAHQREHLGRSDIKHWTNQFPGIFLLPFLNADINLDTSEADTACNFLPHVPWEKRSYRGGTERPVFELLLVLVTVRVVLMQGTPKFLFLFQGMFNLPRDFRPWPMKKGPIGL